MTVGGLVFLPAKLEPRILEKDGSSSESLLPTPTAQTYGSNQGGASGRTGKKRVSLETMARKNMWPEQLPTPTVRDSADKPMPPRKKTTKESGKAMGGQKPPLLTVIGGPLSPEFCELLMCLPLGWTELKPQVMELLFRKREKRSKD
jgi:hypothetical protein